MKILVLGSGAREHAILSSLASEGTHELIVAPGNIGMETEASRIRIDQTNPDLIAEFAEDEQIDLVVIGPEAPLVAGVADAVRAKGITVFGPSKAAAQLEGSKTFAKEIMQQAGVPTGGARLLHELADVAATLDQFGAPYVVKADGLASGKGVMVTSDRNDALRHAEHWLAHGPVLVEEFLDGLEVSLFCIADGNTVRALPPAQDFKRLHNDDAGPNTGGMGAYTPVPFLEDRFGGERAFMDEVVRTVAQPVVDTMRENGNPFQGLLYCGLIVTAAGIRVIEFNARFGDPETQVVLQRLAEPLSPLLYASGAGTLDQHATELQVADKSAVTVVLASEGYPDKVRSGRPISGLDAAAATGALIFHAATGANEEGITATGGRVLNVVGQGGTLQEARRRAYEAMAQISLDGGQFRTDIAQTGAALQNSILAREGQITDAQAGESERAANEMAEQAFQAMPIAPEESTGALEVTDASTDTGSSPSLEDTPIAAQIAAQRAFGLESIHATRALTGWRHVYSGKVREVYESETDADALLVVASNRVSAFDHILEPEIPGKGELLTKLSRWWFDQLEVPNHLREPEGWDAELPAEISARSMRVAKLEMFPVECVVRGYLTGSGLKEYEATGTVCGVPLPEGLRDGDQLPEPIFTPAYKAPQGEHDENISFERVVELIGADAAAALRDLSLQIFAVASQRAAERGVILADTKFEFGVDPATGQITLADEVLTSDSSRYWDASLYSNLELPFAERLSSFDKQIVRNWLRENWDGEGTPPELPAEIVERTVARYQELLERLAS
ncbi:phosphoribosylamine--glycine ligase [Gulosibacter chungangensis]|uniref:Multifunctional fusion protein n=1 Tax=Gulosibacter chungangensis TaxID=979746 RepID=A0A7J5B9G9_9MICO|nr:phosphoribosylamine--glycine ligase [Gulosibacter chungangensis]KAB1642215.1 phosphoribosylamine--glycine ligase [Gulosibacter chungangensis]